MLKIVVGRAGTGKSRYCENEIILRAKEKKPSVLIVPEQSSVSFERAFEQSLAGPMAAYYQIKSFKKLCHDIFAECGHGAKKRIDDAEKCAIIRRAMLAVEPDIKFYKRHKKDRAFFTMISAVIDELKNGGVMPETLKSCAQNAKSELSKQKLCELALIYETYNALLFQQYYDDADEMNAAANLSKNAAQFDNTAIFLDGYSGFTEPEFEMIASLLKKADEVTVTLCCDDVFSDADDCFATVRKNALRLIAIAKKVSVEVAVPIKLTENYRFRTKGLSNAEQFFGSGDEKEPCKDGVFAITGSDLYDEAKKVASEITYLVQNENYKYSDIVIIARDTDRYRMAIERTFERYEIPLFTDFNKNLLHSELTVFLLNALELIKRFDTENILRLLKTNLCAIDEQDVFELENYCFVWDIDGSAWKKAFDQNPEGIADIMSQTAAETLQKLESSRQLILSWLQPLTQKAKGADGQTVVRAVYALMEQSGVLQAIELRDEEKRREAAASIELMSSLYAILGTETYEISEITDIATLLAGTAKLGTIPQSMEQTAFGSADRMRTNNPKATFVIGLNDGIFPVSSFDTPILNAEERELLSANGAELSRNFEQCAVMEDLFLYRAATSACERLYLCYSESDQKGTLLMPSAPIETFLELNAFSLPEYTRMPCPFAVNEKTAASVYAEALEQEDNETKLLIAATAKKELIAQMEAMVKEPDFTIADKNLPHMLLGESSALSSSKIDVFSKCNFMYFMKYLMRIKPLEKATISPVQAGSFVHYIMENGLKKYGGNIRKATALELENTVNELTEQYIEQKLGILKTRPRILYLMKRLKEQALRLLLQIQSEQLQSEFLPADFELSIGKGKEIEPIELMTESGETVYVEGYIDRVDVYQKDGKSYIRVVDYKTGVKKFRLSDIYYGINIQMLLYLFTVCEKGEKKYPEPMPAGVMYLPSDPSAPTVDSNPELEAKKAYTMDGMVLNDPDIVAAMEREVGGIFIPVIQSGKGFRATEKLASLAKFGTIRKHIEKTIIDMANTLYAGRIESNPATEENGTSACEYCSYFGVCRHDRSGNMRRLKKVDSKTLFTEETDEIIANNNKEAALV